MFRPMEQFLANVYSSLPARPTAILVATAHWEAEVATFTGGDSPELIYDYFGFPPETYALTYTAPGALALWSRAPSGRAAHPREEHLLPLMAASGAGSDAPAVKIWSGAAGESRISAWALH